MRNIINPLHAPNVAIHYMLRCRIPWIARPPPLILRSGVRSHSVDSTKTSAIHLRRYILSGE